MVIGYYFTNPGFLSSNSFGDSIVDVVFHTAQKMKFSIKDFFSKCDQSAVSCGFGQFTEEILMENSSFVPCQQ